MKKIKNKFLLFTLRLFILSLGIYFIASTAISQYNNYLSTLYQSLLGQIEQYELENNYLQSEINILQNKDRVISIGEEYGLSYNLENIITLINFE